MKKLLSISFLLSLLTSCVTPSTISSKADRNKRFENGLISMYNRRYPHKDNVLIKSDTITTHDTIGIPLIRRDTIKQDNTITITNHEIKYIQTTSRVTKDSIVYRCDSSVLTYLNNEISLNQDSLKRSSNQLIQFSQKISDLKGSKNSILIWAIIATIICLLLLYLCTKK